MQENGASFIDIGGESTDQADEVSPQEEIKKTLPVIQKLDPKV